MTPGLWSSIREALDGSEWFVLLASPEAASSQWVNREIEHWVSTKPAERILPVVTGGEWSWDPAVGDFSADSSAVPPALRGVFVEEPLFLDLRWAREDQHLKLRHSRFRDAIAQLAAPMHGVTKDDLEGEDVRQHRLVGRLRAAAVTALVVLATVASASGVWAVRNADRATAAAAETVRQQRVAMEQRGNAEKFAGEARVQEANARTQEKRARDAAAEAKRQEENARKQTENARAQQGLADEAAVRAAAQQRLAEQQSGVARRATGDATQQKQLATEQQRLAKVAAEDARKQKQLADEQQRLAEAATKEAQRQKENADTQQRLAAEAAKDAAQQKANADQQRRIAIGRRVNNQAKEIAAKETRTALMLGVAAATVQSDDEARRQLAGLITSTHYAGMLESASVKAVAYSTDTVLITQDYSFTLRLWDVTHRATPTLIAELGSYFYWAVAPDGRTVAVSDGRQSPVFLLDVTKPSSPKVIAEIPVSADLSSITFSQDGQTLFLGAWDEATNDVGDLWDVSEMRQPKPLATQFDGSDDVEQATFSRDGNLLVTLLDDGSTAVWNLTNRTKPTKLATLDKAVGDERVYALAFLRDAPVLAVGSSRNTLLIHLSNPAEPERIFAMPNKSGVVTTVIVSADGRKLVSGGQDGSVALYDLVPYPSAHVVMVKRVSVTDPNGMMAAALSPNGRTLTTVGASTATLWNMAPYGAPQAGTDLPESGEQGLAAAFTPDGRSMLTVGPSTQAAVWDVTDSSTPVRRATPTVHDRPIYLAAVTPDGRTLATTDMDGRVRVSDMTDPARPVTVAEFVEESAWYGENEDELAISPDGKTLALSRRRGTVVLWSVARGRAATRLGPLTDTRWPVAFSPDGRSMAVKDSAGSASLWTLGGPTGPARLKELGSLHKGTMETLAFSPDGQTVAMGGFGAGALWDISQARPRRSGTFTHPGSMSSIAFSRDGKVIAALARYQALLWDLPDRGDPVQIAGMPVTQGRLSPRVTATFSPDGRTLVTGAAYYHGGFGTVTPWDLTKLAELRANPTVQACAMTGRGLTEDEWARYIPELPYQPTCQK